MLRSELKTSGIAFSETPLFKIGLDGHSAHSILKAIQTPLTIIQTHLPSLEDAYLAIVGKEDDH
jgi:ABC-2 type transport system ATP-binding protein